MTEKRFSQYEKDTDRKTLIDNLTGHICEFPNADYARTCCKWLNDTWNKNMKLKQENFNSVIYNDVVRDTNRELNNVDTQLKEKNEQLKYTLGAYRIDLNNCKRKCNELKELLDEIEEEYNTAVTLDETSRAVLMVIDRVKRVIE